MYAHRKGSGWWLHIYLIWIFDIPGSNTRATSVLTACRILKQGVMSIALV